MRRRTLAFASAVVISLATLVTPAAAPQEVRTARAEASVLPQPDIPAASKDAGTRGVDDMRDCAALVLVGSMLLGLAAAVRRTV